MISSQSQIVRPRSMMTSITFWFGMYAAC